MFAFAGPEKTRALVANEPRVYREALADALRRLGPRMEVNAVEPDAFDAEVERLHPHLVHSSARAAVHNGTLTWVRLYPDGENLAEIFTAGGRATIVGVQFDHLLSVVDGTEFARRCARRAGTQSWESVEKTIREEYS